MNLPDFAIIICSKGRRDILTETVRSLQRQSVPARQVLLVVTGPEDADEAALASIGLEGLAVIHSEPGLTRQRNTGIRQLLPGTKYVCFFDDDMELHRDYICNALQFLEEMPTAMALSGRMLRDSCPERAEARSLVEAYEPATDRPFSGQFRNKGRHWVLHGCNMVIRASVLAYERFDERLPLYSFSEDYDISIRIRHYGNVGRLAASVGVHLCTPSGRLSGRRVGYSQIANPWYFLEKGVSHLASPASHFRFAYVSGRLVVRNALASLRGGREGEAAQNLQGNLLALRDILAGSSAPEKILQFP